MLGVEFVANKETKESFPASWGKLQESKYSFSKHVGAFTDGIPNCRSWWILLSEVHRVRDVDPLCRGYGNDVTATHNHN